MIDADMAGGGFPTQDELALGGSPHNGDAADGHLQVEGPRRRRERHVHRFLFLPQAFDVKCSIETTINNYKCSAAVLMPSIGAFDLMRAAAGPLVPPASQKTY
ncbi:hypothetical protein [Mycobacterium adipatum]|uniref:hypothetical protein n=1 Tax=Mycobacterium adipatum TaxID=1682113 RepID=UPI001E581644|nr:hypothetical protein [Mycobacterium adipatum]